LCDQDPAVGVDQSAGRDKDKLNGHGRAIGVMWLFVCASSALNPHHFDHGVGEIFWIFLRRVVPDPRQ
jgi:hypothetical protein